MRKTIILLLTLLLLLTACSSGPTEKYPPQKVSIDNEVYYWNYFNDQGQKIKTEYFRNNELTDTYHYEYDENGDQIKQIRNDADGNEVFRNEYLYENGKKICWLLYRDGKLAEETFYDKNGYDYKSNSYEDGVYVGWSECIYDADYNEIANIYYRSDDTPWLMQEYGHDAEGNFVTTKTEMDENGEIVKITQETSLKNSIREEIIFEK